MRRYSREQWAEWIDEQKCSGLTVSEFCKSIGVSANAFYWRRRRLAATAEAEKSSAASDVQASRSFSKLLSEVGEKANVKVDQKGDKVVYASAHDLRRAFSGSRARRVMPMVLKELMRHSSVTTTEKYYVDIDADSTAALLEGLGDTLLDTNKNSRSPDSQEAAET